MYLSKDQWFDKLKGLVPGWVFEKEPNTVAVFKGMAALLERVQKDACDHQMQGFISKAEAELLDLHGDQRNKPRLLGEFDPPYRERVRTIENSSPCPDIKDIVDTQLINGQATIIEHTNQENFLNRAGYLNRNLINFDVLYNAYTILVPNQVPDADQFLNVGTFANTEATLGTNESSIALFNAIVEAVNKEIAYGTVYRLIERAEE